MNKTDIAENVGKHAFQVAGLGLAPFKFLGVSRNVFNNGDGTTKPGGSCDYCGTAIENEFNLRSTDGKEFKVGCDCIRKAGDVGLLRAYTTSPEYRNAQREKRRAKHFKDAAELTALLSQHADKLAAIPHPYGSVTGRLGGS
jgi:hypothetical protein